MQFINSQQIKIIFCDIDFILIYRAALAWTGLTVFNHLRELHPCDLPVMSSLRYLQVEWEVRKGSARTFTSESLSGSLSRVPLQDNSSDCGLYLLQYVESFLQVPSYWADSKILAFARYLAYVVLFVPGQCFLVPSVLNVRVQSNVTTLEKRWSSKLPDILRSAVQ